MGPDKPLPYNDTFPSTEAYVDSLTNLVGSHDLLRTLCGGVHILDFYTSDPPLFERILPQEWRDFFAQCEVQDVLDLLMSENLDQFETNDRWQRDSRELPLPPKSLLEYIATVRRHLLIREAGGSQCGRNRALKPTQKLVRDVAVGMSTKKVHEVGLFAHYINQNYLGRALASEPYNKRIVAIESKSHNSERAKEFDAMAGLATKQKVMRNKKAFRKGEEDWKTPKPSALPTPPPEVNGTPSGNESAAQAAIAVNDGSLDPSVALSTQAKGSVQYFEHSISDGNLEDVVDKLEHPDPNLMVMSLHSCGNLVHHGLRSLLLNPAVKCVAMVGCCYNLVTERLTGGSYKLPGLDPSLREGSETGQAEVAGGKPQETLDRRCDPHGFPMSERLATYTRPTPSPHHQPGISLNITARMMAVQAPQNWGPSGSAEFFNRHFYRALLQRIFLDKHVVGPPSSNYAGNVSPAGHSSGGTPIIIGHLKKGFYKDFVAYVRGATGKLADDPADTEVGRLVREKLMGEGQLTDEEIVEYERRFRPRKKDLSVIWALMAFSAGVVEAMIVVDRWLWLKEQEEVREAWVEAVFDYALSPRNLVVVGVKK
ncbi:hypothetical protein KC327_g4120 [Hortaea werneckii]|nr:hypothetical protein KC327_g4120 [Hortaea werneckii]